MCNLPHLYAKLGSWLCMLAFPSCKAGYFRWFEFDMAQSPWWIYEPGKHTFRFTIRKRTRVGRDCSGGRQSRWSNIWVAQVSLLTLKFVYYADANRIAELLSSSLRHGLCCSWTHRTKAFPQYLQRKRTSCLRAWISDRLSLGVTQLRTRQNSLYLYIYQTHPLLMEMTPLRSKCICYQSDNVILTHTL